MERITKIGNVIATLLLGDTKITIGKIEEKVGRIDKDITEIKGDVKNINSRCFRLESATVEIQELLKRAGVPICQRLELAPGSPIKLTPYGEEIAQITNAYKFVEDNEQFLFSLIEAKNPKTSYDIQVISRTVLDDILDNSIMDNFKKYVFDNGLNMDIILNVIGVILRDKYLKKFKDN